MKEIIKILGVFLALICLILLSIGISSDFIILSIFSLCGLIPSAMIASY